MSQTTCTTCEHARASLRKFRCGKDEKERVVTGFVAREWIPDWCPLAQAKISGLRDKVVEAAMAWWRQPPFQDDTLWVAFKDACAALDAAQKGKP